LPPNKNLFRLLKQKGEKEEGNDSHLAALQEKGKRGEKGFISQIRDLRLSRRKRGWYSPPSGKGKREASVLKVLREQLFRPKKNCGEEKASARKNSYLTGGERKLPHQREALNRVLSQRKGDGNINFKERERPF